MTIALVALGLVEGKSCGCECEPAGLGGWGGLGALPSGIGGRLPGFDANQINNMKTEIFNNALNGNKGLNLDFGIPPISSIPPLSCGNIDFSPLPGGNIGGGSVNYGTQYVIRSTYGKVLDISQTKPTDAIIYGFHGGVNQRFTITRDGPNSIIRCVQDNGVLEANTQG